MAPDANGWDEWGRHVLTEMERLSEGQKAMQTTLVCVQVSIAKLKIKAGVWGALAGMIPAVVMIVFWAISK